MRKASCDFSCMVPTIEFDEKLISQLMIASRQKKFDQLVVIAQVRINNSKVEFHCSTLITDPDSEINIREDEVPIFLKILSDSEYKQPINNEIDAMKEAFYEMIEETSNQYNANNIYSLISDVAYMNNQLNVRLSLFCPKSSIEIEEIDSSDAPAVCSIPGATYRFPKDKKLKDPNSVYAIYYGINGIKDPRIYSLSYSIYLQQHKKINAAFNNKLYRITFHENEEFELLSTNFCISKPSSITARFNPSKRSTIPTDTDETTYMTEHQQPKPEYQEVKPIYAIPKEIVSSISNLKKEIEILHEEIKERDEIINNKLDQHDEEIKTLLQTVLEEISKKTNSQDKSSKPFSHRQICRKPVIPLTISLTSTFESQTASSDFTQQQLQMHPQSQQFSQFQQSKQTQQNQMIQKQISNTRTESINNQIPSVQQNPTQNKFYQISSTNSKNSIDLNEQVQQSERQRPRYSINMQTSIDKKRIITNDSLNTSAPNASSSKRLSQTSSTNSINNNNNSINNYNTPTTMGNTTSNSTTSNSKVNLNNIKYMNNNNNNSKRSKTSALSIENRSDNENFSSKYSKPSTKFSDQMFNEPSFGLSSQIPNSLNESPNKKELSSANDPSDLSFIINNEYSMETKKLLKMLSMDDQKLNS